MVVSIMLSEMDLCGFHLDHHPWSLLVISATMLARTFHLLVLCVLYIHAFDLVLVIDARSEIGQ